MRYAIRCLPHALFRRVRLSVSQFYWLMAGRFVAWFSGITHGRDLFVGGPCVFLARKPSDIILGDDVVIESRYVVNVVGLTGRAIFHTLCGGRIEIGDNTGLSAPIISSRSSVKIGRNCKIGGNVRIYDHDFHSLDPKIRRNNSADSQNIRTKAVVIEDDVFVGTNAIILKGTHVGARSIIAAGSVVFGLNIPPDSMVKGNPAVVIEFKK